MKTYLDCIPCFFRQALEAARIAGANPMDQKKILIEVGKILPQFSLNSSPPEMARHIYQLVKEITKIDDPFKNIKIESNKIVLGIYDELKERVRHSQDGLLTAVELAIAGNIIDYGVKNSLNINKEIEKILNVEDKNIKRQKKTFFDYAKFKQAVKSANTILYLADNAGETVFDRILIEEIKSLYKNKKIIYAVKEIPIINDALLEDARACGIDKIAEVVSSGLDTPGTIPSLCSKNFLDIYQKAEMVISKGQGNFEALSEEKRSIFFLFMAKCPLVATNLQCQIGDIFLLHNSSNILRGDHFESQ